MVCQNVTYTGGIILLQTDMIIKAEGREGEIEDGKSVWWFLEIDITEIFSVKS